MARVEVRVKDHEVESVKKILGVRNVPCQWDGEKCTFDVPLDRDGFVLVLAISRITAMNRVLIEHNGEMKPLNEVEAELTDGLLMI